MNEQDQRVAWEAQQVLNLAFSAAIRVLNERTKGLTGMAFLIFIASILAVIF